MNGFLRRQELNRVLKGIQKAVAENKVRFKINCVPVFGLEDQDVFALTEYAREADVDIRFIEMMPIGYGKKFEPVYNEELLKKMEEKYGELKPDTRVHGNGPAIYYSVPGFEGSIGFISAIHGKFCKSWTFRCH